MKFSSVSFFCKVQQSFFFSFVSCFFIFFFSQWNEKSFIWSDFFLYVVLVNIVVFALFFVLLYVNCTIHRTLLHHTTISNQHISSELRWHREKETAEWSERSTVAERLRWTGDCCCLLAFYSLYVKREPIDSADKTRWRWNTSVYDWRHARTSSTAPGPQCISWSWRKEKQTKEENIF